MQNSGAFQLNLLLAEEKKFHPRSADNIQQLNTSHAGWWVAIASRERGLVSDTHAEGQIRGNNPLKSGSKRIQIVALAHGY